MVLSYLLLIFLSIAVDYLLHLTGLSAVGKYLGIPGVLLILFSFTYSLRKRKIINFSTPKFLLALHEKAAWSGAVLILVHSGIHFNTLLPWLAAAALMITVASGHFGKFILKKVKEDLKNRRAELSKTISDPDEVERKLFLDTISVDAMNNWRAVHIPFVIIFVLLAIIHIISILFFWRW